MRKTIEDFTEIKTIHSLEEDFDYPQKPREYPFEKTVKRKVSVVQGWRRFGHYVIDSIILAGLGFFLQILQAWFNFSLEINLPGSLNDAFFIKFLPSLTGIIVTVGYYFICEKTMQRTIGKFATNSIVINEYAEAPSNKALLGRSFARLVPFEALSCLSDRGWHDTWSKTYVVSEDERDKLLRLLQADQGYFISNDPDILD